MVNAELQIMPIKTSKFNDEIMYVWRLKSKKFSVINSRHDYKTIKGAEKSAIKIAECLSINIINKKVF